MKNPKYLIRNRFLIVFAVLIISIVAVLPPSIKSYYYDIFPLTWFKNAKVSLGLDLKGGTRLEYNVDVRGVPEINKTQIIAGVQNVIEQRVNGLGVSEPNIYESQVGAETHLVVELAGVDSIDQAKAVVGKVIQLEFKEQNPNPSSSEEEVMQQKANAVLARVLENPKRFGEEAGAEFAKDQIEYTKKQSFYDEIPEAFRDKLAATANGTVLPQIYSADNGYEVLNGQLSQKKGLFVLKKNDDKLVLRKDPRNAKTFPSQVSDSVKYEKVTDKNFKELPSDTSEELSSLSDNQISDVFKSDNGHEIVKLISKQDPDKKMVKARQIFLKKQTIKQTQIIKSDAKPEEKAKIEKENAVVQAQNEQILQANKALKERLEGVKKKVDANPDSFADTARAMSEDTATKSIGGLMGYIEEGKFDSLFDTEVFALKTGDISSVIDSSDGYRLVQILDVKEKGETVGTYETLSVCYTGAKNCTASTPDETKARETAQAILTAVRQEKQIGYEEIFFSTTPSPWVIAKGSNGKALTGEFFKKADTQFNQNSLEPIVSIEFNEEGAKLFEEITQRNIGKPVAIFVGGQLISSPRVNEKISGGQAIISGNFTPQDAANLARDLNTGAIPAPIQLVGQEKVGATIGLQAFSHSFAAGIWGIILISLFMIAMYKMSGVFSSITLVVYALVVYALFSLAGVTLTLAGVAGLILSLGLAVDANVLIFERMRDELTNGESLGNAIEKGFQRAKTAIYASNILSFMIAFILWYFGSSIIKGFAFALMLGILTSLFSSIYLSYTMFRFYEEKWGLHKWFV